MIKRFSLVPLVGTGASGDPIRPDFPESVSRVVLGQIGNRALVKHAVADGTPPTATTLADVTPDGLDVNPQVLTPAQRTAAKTFLQNNGIDVAAFDGDGVTDRKRLLAFVLRRALGWSQADLQRALSDYDINTVDV